MKARTILENVVNVYGKHGRAGCCVFDILEGEPRHDVFLADALFCELVRVHGLDVDTASKVYDAAIEVIDARLAARRGRAG